MKALLEVEQLKKSYSSGFTLGPLGFTVYQGEVLALLGPNGSGKTTCLKIIADLLGCDSGGCRLLNGRDANKKHIGYMSEEISIWPDLNCREQIAFLAGLYGRSENACNELADLLSLADYMDFPGARLSQGNQRKLSFMLSVVHDPDLLILDEPFNGLDATGRRAASKWIRERARSSSPEKPQSVLISSHQLEEVENCADRILILKEGEFVRKYIPGESGVSLSESYHELFDRREE